MKKGMISYGVGLLALVVTFAVTGEDCTQWKECWVFFLLSCILLGTGIFQCMCDRILNRQIPVEELYIVLVLILLFGVQRPGEAGLAMLACGTAYYLFCILKNSFAKRMNRIPEWFPQTVCCITGLGEEMIPIENIGPGQKIVVHKDEIIPLDGIVSLGTATIDERMLSGETTLKTVSIGEEIFAGSVNMEDGIEMRVTKSFSNSEFLAALFKIREEQDEKILKQNYRDKLYVICLPIIILSAALIAVGIPYVLGDGSWIEWIRRGTALLIAAQPFGLARAHILTNYSGVCRAMQRGTLLKYDSIKTLAETNVFLFKKTGVLTTGSVTVRKVMSIEMMEQDLLSLAAHLSVGMDRSIGDALTDAYHGTINTDEVSNLESIPGCGISGIYQNETIRIGNSQLLREAGKPKEIIWNQGIVLYVFRGRRYEGYILLQEEAEEEAAPLLRKMKERCKAVFLMMVSGLDENMVQTTERFAIDHLYVVNNEEEELENLTDYSYTLNDTEKMAVVSTSERDQKLFSIADVGILIGNLTQGAEIKSADVIILTEKVEGLPQQVARVREMKRIKKHNQYIAAIMKVFEILLVIAGLVTLRQIIVVEAISAVLIMLNGIWVRKYADI